MLAGLTFHHLGLALRKEDEALNFLDHLGYALGEKIYDAEQNVYARLCTSSELPDIEILLPGEGKTPLESILKNNSELLYHTCYKSTDLSAFLAGLNTAGIRHICVSPPKPAILFGGRKVSFYHIRGYGLIEILEI